MSESWIYKADATLQCTEKGVGEITLEVMRSELETLIGRENVLDQAKRRTPNAVIAKCGAPTGAVNAYKVTERGLFLLFGGIMGPRGFTPWPELGILSGDPGTGPVVPWPLECNETSDSLESGDDSPIPFPLGSRGNGDETTQDRPVPWPWMVLRQAVDFKETNRALINILATSTEVGSQPQNLVDLIGRRCRVYIVGDPITFDYMHDRVNIELTETSTIGRIWFG